MTDTVHACPRGDAMLTPCCWRPVFELSRTDRITLDDLAVTCGSAGIPELLIDHARERGHTLERPIGRPWYCKTCSDDLLAAVTRFADGLRSQLVESARHLVAALDKLRGIAARIPEWHTFTPNDDLACTSPGCGQGPEAHERSR